MPSDLQIVIPDVAGGVTDYALCLERSLPGGVEIHRLSKRNERQWDPYGKRVILQFSAYGFQRRGVPLWLISSIRRNKPKMARFGVFFHELYALGPPWSSSFYLTYVQRHVCRQMLGLSDFWLTNRRQSYEWLDRFSSSKESCVLPAVSNVGELQSSAGPRDKSVVVFGSASLRGSLYERYPGILHWARDNSYVVHDVGSPIEDAALTRTLTQFKVMIHGRLPSASIGSLLERAQFGVLRYPVEYLAKSSILGAYCAHAVCPVIFSDRYPDSDGLSAGTSYLRGDAFTGLTSNIEDSARAVGGNAWMWYRAHSIREHASRYLRLAQS